MSKSVMVGMVVGSLVGLGAGCAPGAVCGNGIVEGMEECDDGGPTASCWASCVAAPGWECDEEGVCAAICNDGMSVPGELCDPSDPAWEAYCSADCTMITGSCGDEIVQSSEDCDDGMPGGGDGCTDACEASLGWTCPPSGPCDASDVDGTLVVGDLEGADLTGFCTWLIESLGGAGMVFRCGATDFTVNSVATCETNLGAMVGATAACTVSQWEAWVGERSGGCDFFQNTTPICP